MSKQIFWETMDRGLRDCLSGEEGSSVLPFLWLHGEETEEVLKEEIDAIEKSGIKEFCIESRVHEDFVRDGWWKDVDFILGEAQKRNMRVWVLDDKFYPTGYAAGYFKENERRSKRWLKEIHADIKGPLKNAGMLVHREEWEDLWAVIAYKRTGEGFDLSGEALELTSAVSDNMVYFDLPEGLWRVFFIYRTDKGGCDGYIDMLQPQSTDALISAVYEPHYNRYSKYFGNTFAGFFSDEPAFGNGNLGYYSKIGTPKMLLPWRDDIEKMIAEEASLSEKEVHLRLPALWFNIEDKTASLRAGYMNTITKLYSENFSRKLGDWCRARGVEYIGHVVEDMNSHMRLGLGPGHYFRSQEGQTRAGIDVVLNQIIPGMEDAMHEAPCCDGVDPTFNTYALGKLASSCAHLQEDKKGALCEIFGAYGWGEGLSMMRALADHMLVNGINSFVPHAFTPRYPDRDFPPHFYAKGNNPGYCHFSSLIKYMQRMAHLLKDGVHIADVAVFYNAEGEWTGGKYRLFDEIAKKLTRNQIDFDFVPTDALKTAEVEKGRLKIGEESYGALIVSESEILPLKLIEIFHSLAEKGLPVIFTGETPKKGAENENVRELTRRFLGVSVEDLPKLLINKGFYSLHSEKDAPYLKFYHIKRDGKDIYFFRNSDNSEDIDTRLSLTGIGRYLIYNAWDNCLSRGEVKLGEKFRLRLEAGNSVLVIFDSDIPNEVPLLKEAEYEELSAEWDISVKEAGGEEKHFRKTKELFSITSPDALPRFAGEIYYRAEISLDGNETSLDLGQTAESAEVTLNGLPCGVRVGSPYRFNISDAVVKGKNELFIKVTNNPAYSQHDWQSRYMLLPPSGIIGPVKIGK